MKKVTFILLVGLLVSCTANESIEDLMQEGQEVQQIDYASAILGTWEDLEEEENAVFETQEVYFVSDTQTLGGYEYWINNDQLTVKYGTYTEITKTILIKSDTLFFGDRKYLKQ